jgi:hypothetical protein
LAALALLAGVACEDDAAPPEGAAGDAGDAGAPALGGSSAGGACEGDAELWASLTAAPPACETADDCCVVVNSCLAEARVVHADDFDAAQSAWPYCAADCVDCIPPVVRVSCDNGHCVGKVDSESSDDGVSHCGDTVAMAGSPGQSFTCNDH